MNNERLDFCNCFVLIEGRISVNRCSLLSTSSDIYNSQVPYLNEAEEVETQRELNEKHAR